MKIAICVALWLLALIIFGAAEWAKEMKNWPRYEDRREPDDDYCNDMDAQ